MKLRLDLTVHVVGFERLLDALAADLDRIVTLINQQLVHDLLHGHQDCAHDHDEPEREQSVQVQARF